MLLTYIQRLTKSKIISIGSMQIHSVMSKYSVNTFYRVEQVDLKYSSPRKRMNKVSKNQNYSPRMISKRKYRRFGSMECFH